MHAPHTMPCTAAFGLSMKPFYSVTVALPWHSSRRLNSSQTLGQGPRAVQVNVSPTLASRHHCEIIIWIRASHVKLWREKRGLMVKGAYLNDWSAGINTADGRDSRVDKLLQHWASQTSALFFCSNFLINTSLYSQPWESPTALESKWIFFFKGSDFCLSIVTAVHYTS